MNGFDMKNDEKNDEMVDSGCSVFHVLFSILKEHLK